MIPFSKLRYFTTTGSVFIIIFGFWFTFNTHGGYASSMDFDGGIQMELEFPKKWSEDDVRTFFDELKPRIDVSVTSFTTSQNNIFKIEAGRDAVELLEGVDTNVRNSEKSFWDFIKSFFVTPEYKVDTEAGNDSGLAGGDAAQEKPKAKKTKKKKEQAAQKAEQAGKGAAAAAQGKGKGKGKDEAAAQDKEGDDAISRLKVVLKNTWKEKYADQGNLKWITHNKTGPTLGLSLRKNAFNLLWVTMLFIIIYLTVRFEFRFGVAALVALLHDLLFVWGVVGVLQIKPSVPLIAALLTILGYSINDTIVIFDRVRENMRGNKKVPIKTIIDRSINQSVNRTLVTSISTMVSVICLYVFGGTELQDFSFVLLVGILVGTYSSLFIASPVLIFWDAVRAFRLPDADTEKATV